MKSSAIDHYANREALLVTMATVKPTGTPRGPALMDPADRCRQYCPAWVFLSMKSANPFEQHPLIRFIFNDIQKHHHLPLLKHRPSTWIAFIK